MTDNRKDEMPKYTLDDDGDYGWVIDPETDECMSPQKICDLLNARSDLSPPVPDDVDLRHVIDRMRDTITWLNAAGLTVAAEDAETLIRAASTPSADTIAVPREVLQGVRGALKHYAVREDAKTYDMAEEVSNSYLDLIGKSQAHTALARLDAVFGRENNVC